MRGGGAGASRECGGITVWSFEAGKQKNGDSGITVLELLRLEDAKTVIPPHRGGGEPSFWSF